MIERRKHKRVPVSIWVTERSGEFIYTYKALDISEGGMFLAGKITGCSPQKAPSHFRFLIHELDKTIDIDGFITHNRLGKGASDRGSGVMFVNPPEETLKTIRALLN